MFIKLHIPVSDTDYDDEHFIFKEEVTTYAMHLKYRQMRRDMNYKFHYVPVKAFLWDADKNEIEIQDLTQLQRARKKSILMISIDPEDINGDVCEELKSWMRESNLIWNIKEKGVTDRDKVKVLPTMQLQVEIDNGYKYFLVNARMVDDFSDETSNYFFAIIVDRID